MVSMMSWRGLALVSAAVIALCAGMARADGERPDEDHEVSITCCVEPGDEPVEQPGDGPTKEPGEGSGDDNVTTPDDDTGEWPVKDPFDGDAGVGDGDGTDGSDHEVVILPVHDGDRTWPVLYPDAEGDGSAGDGEGIVALPDRDCDDCMVTMSATSVAEAALPGDAGPGKSGLQTALGGEQAVPTRPDGSVRGAGVAALRPSMTGGDCLTEDPLAPLMLCVW